MLAPREIHLTRITETPPVDSVCLISFAPVPPSLDVSLDCDASIPLVAQELMKKMIQRFALEYASKCLVHTTRTSSPLSQAPDAPLDLTVSRTAEEKESESDPGRKASNPL